MQDTLVAFATVTPCAGIGAIEPMFARFVNNESFHRSVRNAAAYEIRGARALLGAHHLSADEVSADIETAIKLGVIRAVAYRWLTENTEHTPDSYYPRNKARELSRIYAEFPEFHPEWTPSTPLTEDEVRAAALEEAKAMFRGRGSDYHQLRLYSAYKVGKRSRQRAKLGSSEDASLSTLSAGELPCVYNDAFRHTVRSLNQVMDGVTLRVASHFWRVFGLIPTLYWVMERLLFPRQYTRLLIAMGGAKLAEDEPQRFEALKHQLARKLRVMDKELEALKTDTRLRDLYDSWQEEEACL